MMLLDATGPIIDRFVAVPDGESDGGKAPLPAGVPLLVGPDRLAEAIAAAPPALGVLWPNNRPLDTLEPNLPRLALVALCFPTFRDGRAYTQARQLRERYGFAGRIRATGQVLRDQAQLLLRCGFDEFAVTKPDETDGFLAALGRYALVYQLAATGAASPIGALRIGR